MKKLALILSIAGVMAAPNLFAAFDGTITLTGGPYQNGAGGQFSASTTPIGLAPNLGSFQTFCIEDNEFISLPGGPYNYRINSGAVAGGNSGAKATDPYTGLPMDNISIGTAYLYSQFRAGTLGNYFGANQNAHAGLLQNAFWELEGEITYDATNPYIVAARTALSKTDSQLQADSNGAYGVVALNLWNLDGSRAQDQLGIVPEPTTMIAGGLLLLPFGASALRIVRKNRDPILSIS